MAVAERMGTAASPGGLDRSAGPTLFPLGKKPFDLDEKLR